MAITTRVSIVAAALLAVVLTLFLAVVVTFAPVILELLSVATGQPRTGGIGAVAGGLRARFSIGLTLLAVLMFLIFFYVLSKRTKRR